MRLTCPNCGAAYAVDVETLPPAGGHVQCSACHTRWFARADRPAPQRLSEDQIIARLESRPRPRLAGGAQAGTSVEAAEPEAEPEAPVAGSPPPADAVAQDARRPSAAGRGAAPAREPGPLRADAGAAPAHAPPTRTAARVAAAASPAPAAMAPHTPLRPRQTAERTVQAAAPPGPTPRSRFLPGFMIAVLLVVVALVLYLRADAVAARLPAAAPAASAYATVVEEARAWIEARLGPLRDRIAGG